MIDLKGGYYGDVLPSSEWWMHSDIFNAFPEAGAVVHTHSVNATALSCMRSGIPPFHYLVAMAGGKDIRCSGYAPFGAEELSRTMLSALDGRKACLLANNGNDPLGHESRKGGAAGGGNRDARETVSGGALGG
jgi:L-fuculose-phosphate aldolase